MLAQLSLYEQVAPLTEALSSPWLVIHVVAAIIATGAFTLGGMASVLFLVKERWGAGDAARLHRPDALDPGRWTGCPTGCTRSAFPVWTFAVLIAGPIWAHYAWSRYWGWDAKEVWAFITWVVYAAYLHARATAGWKGRNAAIIALVGLATLWFNFIGINFFFGGSSQHSYAAPAGPVAVGPVTPGGRLSCPRPSSRGACGSGRAGSRGRRQGRAAGTGRDAGAAAAACAAPYAGTGDRGSRSAG